MYAQPGGKLFPDILNQLLLSFAIYFPLHPCFPLLSCALKKPPCADKNFCNGEWLVHGRLLTLLAKLSPQVPNLAIPQSHSGFQLCNFQKGNSQLPFQGVGSGDSVDTTCLPILRDPPLPTTLALKPPASAIAAFVVGIFHDWIVAVALCPTRSIL